LISKFKALAEPGLSTIFVNFLVSPPINNNMKAHRDLDATGQTDSYCIFIICYLIGYFGFDIGN